MAATNLIPSTCLFIDHKINFKLNVGNYQNIIVFLDANELSFLKELVLDFTKIPLNLHGRGISKNLLEYIANNTDNSSLISLFLNYFISEIIDLRYSSNIKVNFKFFETSDWRYMNFEVYLPYIPGTTTSTTTTTSTSTTSTSTTSTSTTSTTTTTASPTTTTTTTIPVSTTTTTVPVMMFELFGQLYNF